ncbi:formin-binding protein [Xanthoria parietina]
MPGTVAEGPTVAMSFANNFWGKDDAGVQPLLERMHNAKVTCDELKAFYNTRATIEEEYSRKLLTLCRKPLGSSETGTLRASLDVVRGEVESMGKAHQGIAAQMKSELEEPLTAFAGGMKERRKIVQAGVEKLYKIKQQQTQSVNKSRDKYEQDCLKIKGYLAQGHMVMGQEERKNKAKMEKTQIQLASTSNEYEATVKALEETTGRWNRDWKAACDKFQDLEEERLDFTKSSLWTFANVASTVCVSDDASCEKMRLSLESCEVEKDISSFIQERGTGQEIPDPPKYVNFCRGDLNDTASETSDDDNYSVAQFQRTLNPAFRTSSPQPSTYESHHDPQSDLAVKMGHLQAHTPPSREVTVTPQKGAHQPPPIIDYRGQPQTQAPYQHKIDDLPAVPHNEYPTNGMTMFCRTAPPSDRSSAASPMRPSSRDSQSEYSNPTSFSSQEPSSGQQSPFKQGIPAMSPAKQVQKKRSGFFSNSPFRRKSKHEKDGREGQHHSTMTTPTSRNTWGAPARTGASSNTSPTRPSGQGIQTRDFQSEPSPEPVDPRANFQLNVGPNVFDVASPDKNRHKPAAGAPTKELDPIAQALADLKGVGKQSSVRMSADRYAGVATPGPGMTSDLSAAQRGTPPPSYHDQQPVRRLDLPKPAFTSAQMKQTTRNYVGQNQDMYGSSRPRTRGSGDVARATSPLPMRSTSPRPGYDGQNHKRSASPNPNGGAQARHTPNTSPGNQAYTAGYGSRYHSPNDIRRSASPQPQFAPSSRQQQQRPNSSAGMQLQLAPDDSNRGVVSQRARGQSSARPMTYYGGQQAPPSNDTGARNRSRSVANGGQHTKDGRPILEFARALYLYNAAIPEELSFAKGDVLAVLNMQDDGWWEAEVTGKNGRPGLVPSNYLQTC